jgi:hypothetical protein
MMTLLAVWSFLKSPLGRDLAIVLSIIAGIGGYTLHERNVGAANLQAQINKQNTGAVNAAKTVRKGLAAHCRAAAVPADCLRDEWTRD